jgi:hypothetical protein
MKSGGGFSLYPPVDFSKKKRRLLVSYCVIASAWQASGDPDVLAALCDATRGPVPGHAGPGQHYTCSQPITVPSGFILTNKCMELTIRATEHAPRG